VVTVKDKKKLIRKVYFSGYVMIEANLVGEIPHIIKSTSVIGF
jgi:transcriptional antiterminator NusG